MAECMEITIQEMEDVDENVRVPGVVWHNRITILKEGLRATRLSGHRLCLPEPCAEISKLLTSMEAEIAKP